MIISIQFSSKVFVRSSIYASDQCSHLPERMISWNSSPISPMTGILMLLTKDWHWAKCLNVGHSWPSTPFGRICPWQGNPEDRPCPFKMKKKNPILARKIQLLTWLSWGYNLSLIWGVIALLNAIVKADNKIIIVKALMVSWWLTTKVIPKSWGSDIFSPMPNVISNQ